MSVVACPCGCGETFSPVGSRGRARTYFSPGCSLRVNNFSILNAGGNVKPREDVQTALLNPFFGRHHSAETRAVLSRKASVPKPHIRGAKNGMAGRTGPRNPNWQGGTSPERQRLYAGSAWRKLRRVVLTRDRVCTSCGSTATRHLHHVKPWATHPELRFDPDNIVLLCKPCHNDAHRKEVRHQ